MSDLSDITIKDIGIQLEAVKVAWKQSRDGFILTLSVHPDGVPQRLANDHLGTRYKIVMVEIDEHENPVAPPEIVEGKRAVQQAGLLCREPKFWRWLSYQFDCTPPKDEVEAATILCQELNIPSRSVLASDPNARELWASMIRDFKEAQRRELI